MDPLLKLVDEDADPELPGSYDGVVTKARPADLDVRIDELSETHEFRGAPYPRSVAYDPVADNVPPAGTACVVTFAAGDPDAPRVLTIYGWPV